MTEDRWREVEALFHEAAALPLAERARFLDRACAGDADLLREVQSLLDREDGLSFLDQPALDAIARAAAPGDSTNTPTLPPGTRLGPYELLARIGAGGMGEVYRARDTRIDRIVAVKTLSSNRGTDRSSRERFEREARLISALSHPSICRLYDVGRQDDLDFLVMEYLEGETLAARLERGLMTPVQCVQVSENILDALDAAHRVGIVHRDLKPGNVMLTESGAKLLDFGLARIVKTHGGTLESAAATESNLTREGMLVGTIQYMAPEQVAGEPVDSRTDLFAFGVVLYEMLTGRRAFTGKTTAAVAGAILHAEPAPPSAIRPEIPAGFDRLVSVCLAKEPGERWQTAASLKRELQLTAASSPAATAEAAPSAKKTRRAAVRLTLQALVIAGLLSVGVLLGTRFSNPGASPERREVRFELQPPSQSSFRPNSVVGPPAVSPDGTRVAFVATTAGGRPRLWIRSLDSATAQPIAGTEGASRPFWAPDGRAVGFAADRKLKTVRLPTGPVELIGDAQVVRGVTWGSTGVIVFGGQGGLWSIPADGGIAKRLTQNDPSRTERGHFWPHFLPDGRHFLYLVLADDPQHAGIYLGDITAPTGARRVLPDRSSVIYAGGRLPAEGHVLFVRGETLMAQPFDASRLQTTGAPIVIKPDVGFDTVLYEAEVSASQNGVLLYGNANRAPERLVWVDRSGRQTSAWPVKSGAIARQPRLSPDGRRIVVEFFVLSSSELWLLDTDRGDPSRFTFDSGLNMLPVWSSDGRRIAYAGSTPTNSPMCLCVKPIDQTGPEEVLLRSPLQKYPTDWSPDNQHLAFVQTDQTGRPDIWLWSFTSRGAVPLIRTAADERDARFSPDGRWIAYSSDESGTPEIYVQRLSSSVSVETGKWQVSNGGGLEPTWRGDGRELFFLNGDGKVMAAPVTLGQSFEHGVATQLFDRWVPGDRPLRIGYDYAVTPDGQRFLLSSLSDPLAPTIHVNWNRSLP